jgi:hypothetical protein
VICVLLVETECKYKSVLLGSRRNHATVQSYKRGWEVHMQLVTEVHSSECTAQQSRAM